ncbi:hypothetical protein N431DRAFT_463245 [Stipitochalara longipes BDJ]|nr:hypothetical protein N431DRAFT_463245 [Stipitochalara longipes BDJ]
MRFSINLLAFLALVGVNAQVKDGCPKDQVACLDIINSSQCIEQVIIEHQQNLTRENLINCIDTPGVSSSNLPGATKYCLCPGCHSAAINTVIAQMFPPPCS